MNKSIRIFSLILVLLLRAVVSYSSGLGLAGEKYSEELKAKKPETHEVCAACAELVQENTNNENEEREGGEDSELEYIYALIHAMYFSGAPSSCTDFSIIPLNGSDGLFVLFRNFRL